MSNLIFNSIKNRYQYLLTLGILVWAFSCHAQEHNLVTIAKNGWAKNSVNAVIFRKNSLFTHQGYQYAAYYDENQTVVLAKRKINETSWEIKPSQYKGDATDAHKSISIIVDGSGFIHIAWGQHNNPLNYAKSVAPGSLALGNKINMIAEKEDKVSYPEFYRLKDGNLLFFYRDGGSGNGNLMINRYSLKTKTWIRVQDNLIDGQGARNAYWQTTIDKKGTLHISWVWRESPDIASNHDLCYAKSTDGGKTWQTSDNKKYELPINAGNAEYLVKIPQKSELINQTSMYADGQGGIFIATYWRDTDAVIPQFHIVYKNVNGWKTLSANFRKTPFSLSGGGTKKIPISRPQIISWKKNGKQAVALVFRDQERDNKVSLAINKSIEQNAWEVIDLNNQPVGDWEPSFDTALWDTKSLLNLFVQKVTQVDGEGKADTAPTPVQVLQWKP